MRADHVRVVLSSLLRSGFVGDEAGVRSPHGGYRFSEADLLESSLPSLLEDLIRHRAKIHYTFVEGDTAMRQSHDDVDLAVKSVLDALETILAGGEGAGT